MVGRETGRLGDWVGLELIGLKVVGLKAVGLKVVSLKVVSLVTKRERRVPEWTF